MLMLNESKALATFSLVALLAGFAPYAVAGTSEREHSSGYEELECGTADASYLAAPSA